MINHAKTEHPKESCGLIVNGKYKACENVSPSPLDSFEVSPQDWEPCEAVVHSHPNGERYLSGADRAAQHRSHLDWWLVVGDEVIKYRYAPLLIGREFEYGVADCCTIIEDAFMLCGIELNKYERATEKQDIEDMKITNSLADTGFSEVEKPQAGDVLVTSLCGVANHASLYLGDEVVLHHPMDGLSRREIMGGIWHKSIHSIWRHKDWQPEMMQAIGNDLGVNLWQK